MMETVVAAFVDEYPNKFRPIKTWLTLGLCVVTFLLGLPLVTQVDKTLLLPCLLLKERAFCLTHKVLFCCHTMVAWLLADVTVTLWHSDLHTHLRDSVCRRYEYVHD